MNRRDRRRGKAPHGSVAQNDKRNQRLDPTRDFSFGGPLWSVTAERRPLRAPLVEALAAELTTHTGDGAWFSGNVWRRDERYSDNWQYANAIVLDLDFCTRDGVHHSPPNGVADVTALLAKSGSFWANLYYGTPRGARVIYVVDRTIFDPTGYWTAFIGAVELTRLDLARHGLLATRDAKGRPTSGFCINPQVSDLAQVFFTPRATVDGIRRNAQVMIARSELHSFDRLQKCASASNARRL